MRTLILTKGAAAFVVAGVIVAGCGGSSKPATQATTLTPTTTAPTTAAPATTAPATTAPPATSQYAQTFSSIADPGVAATKSFLTAVRTQPPTTRAQLVALTAPFAATINSVDQKMAATAWPVSLQAGIRALIADDSACAADLAQAGSQTRASIPGWEAQLLADAAKVDVQGNAVRQQLGLPPATINA